MDSRYRYRQRASCTEVRRQQSSFHKAARLCRRTAMERQRQLLLRVGAVRVIGSGDSGKLCGCRESEAQAKNPVPAQVAVLNKYLNDSGPTPHSFAHPMTRKTSRRSIPPPAKVIARVFGGGVRGVGAQRRNIGRTRQRTRLIFALKWVCCMAQVLQSQADKLINFRWTQRSHEFNDNSDFQLDRSKHEHCLEHRAQRKFADHLHGHRLRARHHRYRVLADDGVRLRAEHGARQSDHVVGFASIPPMARSNRRSTR